MQQGLKLKGRLFAAFQPEDRNSIIRLKGWNFSLFSALATEIGLCSKVARAVCQQRAYWEYQMLLDPRGHSGNIISKVPDTLIEESNKSEKELYVWNIAIWFSNFNVNIKQGQIGLDMFTSWGKTPPPYPELRNTGQHCINANSQYMTRFCKKETYDSALLFWQT